MTTLELSGGRSSRFPANIRSTVASSRGILIQPGVRIQFYFEYIDLVKDPDLVLKRTHMRIWFIDELRSGSGFKKNSDPDLVYERAQIRI